MARRPKDHAPKEFKSVTNQNDRVTRLDLDAALIRQEHRVLHILANAWWAWSFPVEDPRRKAAIEALLWHLVPASGPVVAGAGVGITALVGLYFAYQANSLVAEQNKSIAKQSQLLESQNANLEKQNALIAAQHKAIFVQNEAAKRSALSTEITAVCERVEDFIESQGPSATSNSTVRHKLPNHLEARIAALTVALRPYEDSEQFGMSPDGDTIYGPSSPERGYLLQLLVKFGVNLETFATHSPDFTYALLDNASLNGMKMPHASLRQARISGAFLSNVDLSHSILDFVRMDNSHLDRAILKECRLSGAELSFIHAESADFSGSELFQVKMNQSILDMARFDDSSLTYVEFVGATLVGASFANADLRAVKFSRADLRGVNFTGALLGVNPPTHNRAGLDLENAIPCGRQATIEFLAADFAGAINLTAEQVIKAKNWRKAKFDAELQLQLEAMDMKRN